MYPSEYLYSEEHEWISVDGDIAILGITDFAQSELGEVVYFEAPEAGQSFVVGDEVGSIESVKAVSSIFAPVSGEVIEVNEALEDTPEVVNDDPHGDGWLFRLKMSSPSDIENMMSVEKYQAFLEAVQDD